MAKIVVADDDADIRELVAFKLRQTGHDIVAVADGAAAVEACQAEVPDLVLLDVMMPGMSGLDACRALRADAALADVPVILLTARAQEADIEQGFSVGADDYVVKPFGMDELLARLRAAIRRGEAEPARPTIETEAFTIDLAAGRVTVRGTEVKLTPTEWHLLEVLARNRGKVVEHGRLLTEVWGPAYREQTNYLRVYMATLRRKLEPDAANPRYLLTEAGRGYRLEPTPARG